MATHDVGEFGLDNLVERQVVCEVAAVVTKNFEAQSEQLTFGFGIAKLGYLFDRHRGQGDNHVVRSRIDGASERTVHEKRLPS